MKNEHILLLAFVAPFVVSAEGTPPALVPLPREVAWQADELVVTSTVAFAKNDWYDFDRTEKALSDAPVVVRREADVPKEGYRLTVTPAGTEIVSSDAAGDFYARQTLRQLMTRRSDDVFAFRCCTIADAPAYPWRGVLLDEARHFLGKTVVKRTLEQMARHKLNVLHWHLTDDQGWRLDIPGRPELVQYGAVRPQSAAFGTHVHWLPPEKKMGQTYDGEKYGPFFYTPEDVREILSFARERHVTVVPEIELPGHVRAFLAAHPECACREDLPRVPRTGWSVEDEVLCVGNDESVRLFAEILDRVCELFPDAPFVHIGGDECPRKRWKTCAKCQARMKAEGLSDETGLQTWITTKMVRHLERRGRRAIGWDEMLAGDVPVSAVGMSWRPVAKKGGKGTVVSAAEAAARGHDLVMTPTEFCYLDMEQGLAHDPYPYYSPWTAPITLEKAFSFDPCAGIPAKDRPHVLGGQANMWGESIFNVFDLEWKMWPRTCALAEVLWLGDAKPPFADFAGRIELHRVRLLDEHVNCAPVR